MPVTARLSQKFYERLGDDIANELVDWFNAVDETYRTQLTELNELNWKRFQASMDAGFAAFEVKMQQRLAALEAKMEQGMAALEAKMEQGMSALEAKIEQRITALDVKMERRFAEFEVRIARQFTAQTRWAVGLWLATVVPLGALMIGLFNFAR